MWYNNPEKEILILDYQSVKDEINKVCDFHKICWKYNDYSTHGWCFFAKNKTIDEITNDIDSKFTSSIKDAANLYFYKQSKFPRFKLQETDYKRVIKQDKADYFVVPQKTKVDYFGDYYVCENDCAIFLIKDNFISIFADNDFDKFLKVLEKIDNRANFDAKPTYFGPIYRTKEANSFMFDLIEKFPNTKAITDKDMDNIVCKKFQAMTENDLNTILPMLKSNDKETVGLGLKLVANMNILETPYLVFALLSETYNNWCYSPAKTSVAVNQMLKTLDFCWSNYGRPIYKYGNIYNKVKKTTSKEPTKEEIELIRKYFVDKQEMAYVNQYCSVSDELKECPFSPKITITIE